MEQGARDTLIVFAWMFGAAVVGLIALPPTLHAYVLWWHYWLPVILS